MVHGDTFQPSVEPSSSRSLLNTPPPPYKDAGTSPLVVTETTTRTEVVTTTTTHFFSLPIWRRRAQPSSSRPNSTYESKSTRPSSIYDPSSLTVCEDGALIPQSGLPRSGSLMLEKALPPIPPPQPHTSVDFPVSSRSLPSLPSSTESNGSRPPRSFPQSPNKSPGLYSFPSHSQTALAQASLGLTLSHILPSDSSSTTEVNTIAFVTSPASPTDAAPPPLRLRHKSSQKLKSNPTASKLSIEDGDERRRTRGFSFGPASFLNFTPEAKSKGKDKTVETPIDDQPIPRTLSRKGSFWSRKKSLTSADDLPRPTTNVLDLPPLPPVQPLSPFNVNLDLPLSSGPPTLQSLSIPAPPRGLSRSLSERTSPKYAEQSPIMAHSPLTST
ncbi:hypothetical protein BDN72DRAFT_19064 [Pluteus cervinus]|uniref:Uncharacterized protein n=1 Tax=Pluteus cervinus TaxID=181527 RepID=A0ACD3BFY3_9AGAR|nr:hypothetical protein BDN72DRAFT_19064 [Pluteus cervinus]